MEKKNLEKKWINIIKVQTSKTEPAKNRKYE